MTESLPRDAPVGPLLLLFPVAIPNENDDDDDDDDNNDNKSNNNDNDTSYSINHSNTRATTRFLYTQPR